MNKIAMRRSLVISRSSSLHLFLTLVLRNELETSPDQALMLPTKVNNLEPLRGSGCFVY